jgi:protein-tyrosine phosphatase
MIDLHTHVLPGLDDGPPDAVGSLAMLDIAAADGVRILVATPHIREDYPAVIPGELADRVAVVNDLARRYDLDIEVVPGGEVSLETALLLQDDDLRDVTLGQNGHDLLVETPHGPLPANFEGRLDAVRSRGMRITLAHPEINPDFQRDSGRLVALAADGFLLQITASSLTGPRRSRPRALALKLLSERLAHVIASDAHAPRWREPRLRSQLEELRSSHAELDGIIAWATEDAPRAILAAATLTPPPANPRRRRLFHG